MQLRFAILDVRELHPHEMVRDPVLRALVEQIRRDGRLVRPLLVERAHHVILDGHHRYEALKALGCRRVPVYLVDYEDEGISVGTWEGATVAAVTKDEIVSRGVKGDLFPPKTTRHKVAGDVEDRPVTLEELR